MVSVKKIEDFLLHEINAREDNTFMYQLNENDLFLVDKLYFFIDRCDKLIEEYMVSGKTERYNDILRGVNMIFMHTLFLLHIHFVKEDTFKIKNHDELSPDIISDFYLKMRDISKRIVF